MSYQVLARKWRPRSFGTLVGQEHVVKALSHALATGRLHHAWLFTGTRGVGKTTISRILAKALNCEQGVTAEPCGQCAACRAIDADRFPDYVEMDAASNRGVEDMAALLDQAVYAPTQGRYKVYMIDEVHMLTGHAFNAMLKTLEEPPEHVKFILATTDPQKIPVTVLSRCLQFNLKQMPTGHIVEHLGHILSAEKLDFEPSALRHIAKAANGSMRDALSLLDQAIAHGAGSVTEAQVTQMLGMVGDEHLYAVLNALLNNEAASLLAVVDDIASRSLSFDAALQTLASLLHRCALGQFAPEALAEEERTGLKPFMDGWDPEYLQLAYQIAVQGRADLGLAPDEQAGFSMTLLRMLAFRPEQPPPLHSGGVPVRGAPSAVNSPAGDSVVGQASQGQPETARPAGTNPPSSPESTGRDAPSASAVSVAAAAQPAQAVAIAAPSGVVTQVDTPAAVVEPPLVPLKADAPPAAPRPQVDEGPEPPAWVTEEVAPPWGWDEEARSAAPIPETPSRVKTAATERPGRPQFGAVAEPPAPSALPREAPTSANPSAGFAATAGEQGADLQAALVAQNWHGAQRALGLGGMVRELAQHCEWLAWEQPMQSLRLRLSHTHRHLLDMNPGLAARLGETIGSVLGCEFRLTIEVGEIAGETPAQRDAAERKARHAEAVATLEQDPFVRELIERFDATLLEDSVKPL